MARFDAARVRQYYDTRTPAFVALGQGRDVGAIHRTVWGPGVTDQRGALHYVEDRIADLIRQLPPRGAPPHIVDLGCGVAASLSYLAQLLPIRATGVTLSPVQAGLAARRLRDAGLAERVAVMEADYADLPPGLPPADLAFAIESFVHAPDPVRLLDQCRRLVRPGGVLAICDDFRRPGGGRDAARAIEQFCEGWHVNTLVTRDELQALARAAGFEHRSTDDLSPYLELHRMRDRLISAVVTLASVLPAGRRRLVHFAGGRALQRCLERGWVGYDLAVFRRGGS
jgi:SAM-dependent methyltransferase